MDELKAKRERIEQAARRAAKPFEEKRKFERGAWGKKTYRGKPMFWVGYNWSRWGAHHFNGLVYDAPLAYGQTLDEAIAKLEAKYPEVA